MKGLFPLLRVNFQNLLVSSANIGSGRRKKAISTSTALLFLGSMLLFVSGVYSFSMTAAFAIEGGADLGLMVALIMAIFFPTMLMLFGAQGVVFSAKDADLVFSLPASNFAIMLSRVLALYLEALIMVEIMVLPAAVAYMVFGGGGVLFLLASLASGALLAFLPTLIALVFGFLVSFVVARLPFKNLLTVVVSMGLVVGILVVMMRFSYSMENTENMLVTIADLRNIFSTWLPPVAWFAAFCITGAVLPLVYLLGVTVLPFLLVVWLFSLFYKSIITRLSSHKLKSNFKLRNVSASGSFGAMLKKELGKFFGTPIFLLNSGIMPILMVLLSVFAFVRREMVQEYIALLFALTDGAAAALLPFFPVIVLGLMAFGMSVVYSSAVSISLEGKCLWLLKAAPLSTGRIFAAKAAANVLVDAVMVLICVPLLGLALNMAVLDCVMIVLVALLFGTLDSALGVYINLMFPRLDYVSETQVIKNSASVLISMLAGVVLLLLVGGLYLLCYLLGTSFALFGLLATALLALLLGGTIALLHTRGRRRFEEL